MHPSRASRRKTGKPQTCAVIRDGDADGELLVGKDDAGEQQHDGEASPWPAEHDDSQDEGDGQSEMENGAYHFSTSMPLAII